MQVCWSLEVDPLPTLTVPTLTWSCIMSSRCTAEDCSVLYLLCRHIVQRPIYFYRSEQTSSTNQPLCASVYLSSAATGLIRSYPSISRSSPFRPSKTPESSQILHIDVPFTLPRHPPCGASARTRRPSSAPCRPGTRNAHGSREALALRGVDQWGP